MKAILAAAIVILASPALAEDAATILQCRDLAAAVSTVQQWQHLNRSKAIQYVEAVAVARGASRHMVHEMRRKCQGVK